MNPWCAQFGGTLLIACCLVLSETVQAQALDGVVKKLNDPNLHCGQKPKLDLFDGVMNALAVPQSTARGLTLKRNDRRLELLIHFDADSSDIPVNCLAKLHAINQSTKTGKTGPILIRSSTRHEASKELGLALASQRLEAIEHYLRDHRLARKAFVLELHPDTSSPLFGAAITLPNVIEVYSSPAN
ncbi:hypothetical protein [Limnobacter sp.]|uniref:hypothetical protein n=1 Tax=Limnobacter sp. TaxID=2003368 RepID=UPI002FDF3A9E